MIASLHAEVLKLVTTRLPLWLLVAAATLAALLVFVTVPQGGAARPGDTLTLSDSDLLGPGQRRRRGRRRSTDARARSPCLHPGTSVLRTITPTFLVTPSRPRVVLAKMAAIALTGVGFATVVTAVSVVVSAALIHARGGALTGSADVAEVVIGATAAIVIYGLLGVAVGALLQNQVAALVGSLIWLLVVEQLLMALFPVAGRWTVAGATSAVVQLGRASTYDTRPSFWAGAALLITYTLLVSVAAVFVTTHRDVT